jgi:hypothetical protein
MQSDLPHVLLLSNTFPDGSGDFSFLSKLIGILVNVGFSP